jgi:hypothetical protein
MEMNVKLQEFVIQLKKALNDDKEKIKKNIDQRVRARKLLVESILNDIEEDTDASEIKNECKSFIDRFDRELERKRKKLSKIKSIEPIIKKLYKNITSGFIFNCIQIIKKNPKISDFFKENYPNKLEAYNEFIKDLEKEAEKIYLEFPIELSKALEKDGIKLDVYSNYPKLSVAKGFIKIEIDEKKRIVKIRDYERILCQVLPDIETVAKAVIKEYERLFNREFKGDEFLSRLWNKYKEIIQADNLEMGSSIPIRKVINELKQNNKKFRLDEFMIDLARLLERGPSKIEGHEIDFQNTRDIRKGLIIPSDLTRGYIGYIIFRRINYNG